MRHVVQGKEDSTYVEHWDYEHGEEVVHRAYGAGRGRQNQSNGSHRKANQIGTGDASTARGELIRPKQAAVPNTTAPEIAALEVWAESHWPGCALRESDVLKT